MRSFNRINDTGVTIIQKGMEHDAIDKNELQDEADVAERNVADAKNTLDAAKIDESNARVIFVSTQGGRNRKKTPSC